MIYSPLPNSFYIPSLTCFIYTNSFRNTFFCEEIFAQNAILYIFILHFMKSHPYFVMSLNNGGARTNTNASFDIQMCTIWRQSTEIEFTFGDTIFWFWMFALICCFMVMLLYYHRRFCRFFCQNPNALRFKRLLAITIVQFEPPSEFPVTYKYKYKEYIIDTYINHQLILW